MRRSVLAVGVLAIAAAVGGAWLVAASLGRSGASLPGLRAPSSAVPRGGTASAQELTGTIILDPPYNLTRFDPPAPTDRPGLSAEEAMARFRAVVRGFTPPPDATARLGRYTAATGVPGIYRFRDRLAWGYSWHECGLSMGNPRHLNPPVDTVCITWLFLDADTGEMLEETNQH